MPIDPDLRRLALSCLLLGYTGPVTPRWISQALGDGLGGLVLFGSNLGNGNAHTTTNLPILFAGGPWKHGQHLAFDREKNMPLARLFVSLLQGLGLEADRFASGAGTLPGLEARA